MNSDLRRKSIVDTQNALLYAIGYIADIKPRNFTITGIGPTAVRLQWDPPASWAQGQQPESARYEVRYRRHDRTPADGPITVTISTTSLIVDRLRPSTSYLFRLRAVNTPHGDGPWTDLVPYRTSTAQTHGQTPAQPMAQSMGSAPGTVLPPLPRLDGEFDTNETFRAKRTRSRSMTKSRGVAERC